MANLYQFLSSAPSAQQGFAAGVQNMDTVLKSADSLNKRYSQMGTDAANLEIPVPQAQATPLAGLAMPNRPLGTATPATPEAFSPAPALTGTAVAPEVMVAPAAPDAATTPGARSTVPVDPNAPASPAERMPAQEPAPEPGALSALSGAELRIALAPTFAKLEKDNSLPAGYLDTVGAIETGGSYDPRAQNKSSTAGGLFQFIDSTARQYGLTNKYDPQQSAAAAASFARANAAELTAALGRAPTGAELYLAHNQGASGAKRLLANPNASALQVLTQAYSGDVQKATAALTNNGGNANMTAQQFVDKIRGYYDSRSGTTTASATTRPVGLITPANPQGEVYATTQVAQDNLRKFTELDVPFKAEMAGTIASAINTGTYTDVSSNVVASIWRWMTGTDTPTATQQAELQSQASAWYQSDEADNWFNTTRKNGSAEQALADPMAYFLAYNNAKALGSANVAEAQQVIDTTLSAAGAGAPTVGATPATTGGVTVNNVGRTRGTQEAPLTQPTAELQTDTSAAGTSAPPRISASPEAVVAYTGTPANLEAIGVDTRQVMLERQTVATAAQATMQQNVSAAQLVVEQQQNIMADLSRQAQVLMQEEADVQRMREYYRQRAVNAQNAGNVSAMESALTSMESQTSSLRTLRSNMNSLTTKYTEAQTAIANANNSVGSANELIAAKTRAELNKFDQQLYLNQGYVAQGELTLTGNPARVSQVWSAATGQSVVVQPRTDGKFSIVFNGEPVMGNNGQPMAYSATQLNRQFMSSISQTMGEKYAVADATAAESALKFTRETLMEAQKAMATFNLEQFKQGAETARVHGQYTITKGEAGQILVTRNGMFDASGNAVVFMYDPNIESVEGQAPLSPWQATQLPVTGLRN